MSGDTAVCSRAQHAVPAHQPPAPVRATGIVLALTAAIALIAIAFALPAGRSAPHDVPIGIAGPPAVGRPITATLDEKMPGAFEVTSYPDADALRDAVRSRDVYGGLVFRPQGVELLIATGGSPAVAQLLTQLGTDISRQTGVPLRTEDLAPPASGDPRGTGLAASALPITMAGLLPAIALLLVLKREIWTRTVAMAVAAAVTAVTLAALLRWVLGAVDANFWGVTAALTLGLLGVGLTVLGLGSLFGRPGVALGVLLALLLGNPLSGLAGAPELLPSGWGQLGQWLPQGATATLLRSAGFFDGAGGATPALVLSCWALAGLALIVIAAVRQREFSAG